MSLQSITCPRHRVHLRFYDKQPKQGSVVRAAHGADAVPQSWHFGCVRTCFAALTLLGILVTCSEPECAEVRGEAQQGACQ